MTTDRCEAAIYKRDTYRVSRRPGPKFKMHYEKARCARKATRAGFCEQHAKMAIDQNRLIERLDWQ